MDDVPEEYSYNNAALVGGSIFAPNTANKTYLQALMLNADNEVPGTLDALKRIQAKRIKGKKPARSSASSEKLSPALRAALYKKTPSGGSLIGAIIKFGIKGGIKRIKEVFGARKEQKAELARLKAKKAQMGGKRIRGGSFKSFLSDLKTMLATPIMPLNVALLVKKKQREKEIAKLKKEVGEGGKILGASPAQIKTLKDFFGKNAKKGGSLFGPSSLSREQKKTLNDFFGKIAKKKQPAGGDKIGDLWKLKLEQVPEDGININRERIRYRPPRGGTKFSESVKDSLKGKPLPNGIDIFKEQREAHERIQELLKKYHPVAQAK